MVRRKKLQESCRKKKKSCREKKKSCRKLKESERKVEGKWRKLEEKEAIQVFQVHVSQVTYGPRRGPTFNNRWWNDQRSWNLRTSIEREESSPKGANHIQSCSCSPPLGTIEREYVSYPQVPWPLVIPPAVIHIRPLRGRQNSISLPIEISFVGDWNRPHSESK